jgi:CPA2 family monovalent cation:H+ antiporter-2
MDTHNISHITLLLATAFMSGLFVRRLRQPALIGYILAGVMLGPSVLGLIHTTETIEWLAELGIVFLMFMIGLELDMRSFKASLTRSLSIVAAQVSISIISVALLSIFFPVSMGFAVLIGSAIALSSTAVAITVLKDLRQEHTDAGRLTTSILVAQDLAVIPLLILIQLIGGDGISAESVLHAGAALAVVILSLGGILYLSHHPRLVRRIQTIFSHGTDQPALAAMACIFAAATISGFAGLSAAYGAFALGLLLRNIGEVGDTYAQAITPLHDLLLMVFFLSVGIILNLSVVWHHALIITALLALVIILKTVGNTLLLIGWNISWRGRLLAAAALSQIGEFSFVILGLGLSTSLISQDHYQIGLAVIALSLVISPIWIGVVKRLVGIRTVTLFTQEPPSPGANTILAFIHELRQKNK